MLKPETPIRGIPKIYKPYLTEEWDAHICETEAATLSAPGFFVQFAAGPPLFLALVLLDDTSLTASCSAIVFLSLYVSISRIFIRTCRINPIHTLRPKP